MFCYVSYTDRLPPESKAFLGNIQNSNMRSRTTHMLDETRKLLFNYYDPWNRQLAQYLNDARYKFL